MQYGICEDCNCDRGNDTLPEVLTLGDAVTNGIIRKAIGMVINLFARFVDDPFADFVNGDN